MEPSPVIPSHLDQVAVPLLTLDPIQSSLRQLLATQKQLQVFAKGNAPERHTKLILQILIDGLCTAQRTALIVDDKEIADHYKAALKDLKLDAHAVEIYSLSQDQGPILEALAEGKIMPQQAIRLPARQQAHYEKLQINNKQQNQFYRQSRQLIFNQLPWFSILGNYLSIARQRPSALIDSRLDPTNFSFQPTEFAALLDKVNRMQAIYEKVGSLQHPLRHLKSAIFIHFSEEEAFLFVDLKVEHYLAKFSSVFHRLIAFRTHYADHLLTQWESRYQYWQGKISALFQLIETATAEVGQDYLNSKSISLQMSSLVSEKSRAGLRYKGQLERQYASLRKEWEMQAEFVHSLPEWKQGQALRLLRKTIEKFWTNWYSWYQEKDERLRDELNRLNHKTAQTEETFIAKLGQLEGEFDTLVESLNETELFELPLRATMLTLDQRLRLLEDTIGQLSEIQRNLKDFKPFYQWQYNIMEQAAPHRRLFIGLARARSKDWRASFQAWYWRQCLRQAQGPFGGAIDFKSYKEEFEIGAQTWLEKLQQDFYLKKRTKKKSHKTKLHDPENNALIWWENHKPELASRFPIWTMTAAVANKLLSKKDQLFSQIIRISQKNQELPDLEIQAEKRLDFYIKWTHPIPPKTSTFRTAGIFLHKNYLVNRLFPENNAFYEELALRIQAKLPTAKICTDVIQDGTILPLVVQIKGKADQLILADGYLAETPETNMFWEAKKQQQLEENGYRIIRTSTQAWWRHPAQAWDTLWGDISSIITEEE